MSLFPKQQAPGFPTGAHQQGSDNEYQSSDVVGKSKENGYRDN
jgi:hypothetical protein